MGLLVCVAILTGACWSPAPEPPERRPALELSGVLETVADGNGAVRRDVERGLVTLPEGSAVELPALFEPGSELRLDRLVGTDGDLALEVRFETDTEGDRLLLLEPGEEPLRADLEVEGRTPGRLSLRAVSVGDRENRPSAEARLLVLERPWLWSRSPESPVEGAGSRPTGPPAGTPVVVYLIDTLRRDRLGCYGYRREVSPRIDAFAARATLLRHAVAQSSWTKPSVASLFTGVWPPVHGATGWRSRLPDGLTTLAEALGGAGYRTAAFLTNPNVIESFGMLQGFDEWEKNLRMPSAEVNSLVFDWLGREGGAEPFFLYVHTVDPHAPYDPPEPYRSRFAPTADEMPSWTPHWKWPREALPYLSDLYDGEIAANDASFGELLDHLRELGLYDRALIVLTSDHGEAFKEHGRWRHGNDLHFGTLDVPLMIKLPGQLEGAVVDLPVQHADLLPTILDAVDLPVPAAVEGRSLLPVLEAKGRDETPRPVFSHLDLGRNPHQQSVVVGEWKLVRSRSRRQPGPWSFQLYRWRDDPRESLDLAGERPVTAAALSAEIDRHLARSAGALEEGEDAVIDRETEEALRALGYLEDEEPVVEAGRS